MTLFYYMTLHKAEPVGPPWALTWSARRAPQHFSPVPPPSLSADSSEARSCETSDPMATCTFVSHKRTQSLRIVTMSPTRLLATFVDDETEAGTAVVIKVVQHLPDKWEFNTGVKVERREPRSQGRQCAENCGDDKIYY